MNLGRFLCCFADLLKKDAYETEGESLQNRDQSMGAAWGRNVGYGEAMLYTDVGECDKVAQDCGCAWRHAPILHKIRNNRSRIMTI